MKKTGGIDYKETFRICDIVMSHSGIRIFATSKYNDKLWLCWQFINCVCITCSVVFNTVYVWPKLSDIFADFGPVAVLIGLILVLIVLYMCLILRSSLRDMVEEMAFNDPIMSMPLIRDVMKSNTGGKMGELKELLFSTNSKLMYYSKTLYIFYFMTDCMCFVLFIGQSLYLMATREDLNRLFGFQMWYPWSVENIYVYIATFILNMHSSFLAVTGLPAIIMLTGLLVGQIIRQLKILVFILLNISELVSEMSTSCDPEMRNCQTILKQCMQHYVKLKKSRADFNRMFQPAYLALFTTSAIGVCISAVKLGRESFSVDMVFFYLYTLLCLVMVLLFCQVGQLLENKSEELELALDEKWYMHDKSYLRQVMIFRLAVGQRMTLNMFASTTLSAPSFAWYLRTIMSLFTLVKSFY